MGSDVLQPPHYDAERPDFSGIAESADGCGAPSVINIRMLQQTPGGLAPFAAGVRQLRARCQAFQAADLTLNLAALQRWRQQRLRLRGGGAEWRAGPAAGALQRLGAAA